MSAAQPAPGGSLAAAFEIDKLCDEFEAALTAGMPPLDGYLRRVTRERRLPLLRELLPLLADNYRLHSKLLDVDELQVQVRTCGELGADLGAELKSWLAAVDVATKILPASAIPNAGELGPPAAS